MSKYDRYKNNKKNICHGPSQASAKKMAICSHFFVQIFMWGAKAFSKFLCEVHFFSEIFMWGVIFLQRSKISTIFSEDHIKMVHRNLTPPKIVLIFFGADFYVSCRNYRVSFMWAPFFFSNFLCELQFFGPLFPRVRC